MIFCQIAWEGIRIWAQQAQQGTEVDPGKNFEKLRKGDLLFFAENTNAKKPVVTHVAIYLQDQTFIHSSGMVRLNSFDPASPLFDAHRRKTFVAARRVLCLPIYPDLDLAVVDEITDVIRAR